VRLRQRPECVLLYSAPIGGSQAPRHRFADCGPGQTSHSRVVVFGMKYLLLSGVVCAGAFGIACEAATVEVTIGQTKIDGRAKGFLPARPGAALDSQLGIRSTAAP
jgi:hypothetical protein